MGSGALRPATPAAVAVDRVDAAPLCCEDFAVSPSVAKVCEAVGNFAHSPLLSGLFKKMAIRDMIESVEANAMKVWLFPTTSVFFCCYDGCITEASFACRQ